MAEKRRDGVAECFTRKRLDQDLEAEIARAKRYGKPLSLLMMLVDWPQINDDPQDLRKRDESLQRIGRLALRSVRIVDKVYRYEDGQFVVLLPESDKVEALSTAERLQGIIENGRFETGGANQDRKKRVVSMGVVSYPWDANSREDLLKSAESALSAAKQLCRNKICFFDFSTQSMGSASQAGSKIRSI